MEEWPDLWKIGQVADALGTTPRTLRFYEEQGLLTPRRTERGTRLYTAHDWERARLHRQAEALRDMTQALMADAEAAEAAVRQCRDCPNPPTPTGCPRCPALARLEEDTLLNLIWDPEEGGKEG